jgi:hypothetical protein
VVNCGVVLWTEKVDGVRTIFSLIYFRFCFFCAPMIDTISTVVLLCCGLSGGVHRAVWLV